MVFSASFDPGFDSESTMDQLTIEKETTSKFSGFPQECHGNGKDIREQPEDGFSTQILLSDKSPIVQSKVKNRPVESQD